MGIRIRRLTANEVTKLDADMLKYLYDNKKSLLVVGDGYTISLDGNNIVNYRNEFMTDIQLASIEKSSEEGICFVINDGKPLCGDVTLCLDNVNGKYIYLYNEAKEQYELIEATSLSEVIISTPGKYLITNSKIRTDNLIIVIISSVGGIVLFLGVGLYIGFKKRYWFW